MSRSIRRLPGRAPGHHLLAQQSTSRRQMRWISMDLRVSSTWFSLAWGEGATERSSRGAIQRSEIGSYHLPRLTKLVSPLFHPPPGFNAQTFRCVPILGSKGSARRPRRQSVLRPPCCLSATLRTLFFTGEHRMFRKRNAPLCSTVNTGTLGWPAATIRGEPRAPPPVGSRAGTPRSLGWRASAAGARRF